MSGQTPVRIYSTAFCSYCDRARALLTYGNASQPGSPHRTDQFSLYATKELREVWRTREEVERNLILRERF